MTKSTPTLDPDERLIAVLDSVSDVFYALDRSFRIILFNRRAEEFFGRPRDQILGQVVWNLYPVEQGPVFAQMIRDTMGDGVPRTLNAGSILQPGRSLEVRIAPIGNEGVGVSINDVTERARAERELRRSERRLNLAVGANRIGIFDWHIPSGSTVWSPEMEDIFGLRRGGFEGRAEDFRRRLMPEDLSRFEAEIDEALATGAEHVTFEFRILRADGAIRWLGGAAQFVRSEDGRPVRMVGTNVDITDRKVAEAHQRLLINELNHRVKNTLAIVQGIAWQSFRMGGVPAEVRHAFEGRLAALSAAHNVLTRQSWEAGAIAHIIEEATAPHHAGDGRLTLSGPGLDLEPKTAVALGLAMHELATNAVKHGALSERDGRVQITWTAGEGVLRLTWRESGGPPVRVPAVRGFGTRLLEQGLAADLGGRVNLDFRADGLVCTVEAALT
ncbi:HWE histidine kinase domain-containing protein [Phenylobacterium sp.]|uniref:sensor histidine kinase n=1 Tax=Phenylobacterium sp. TaxID=1871053 RepID=UPI00301BB99F